MKGVRTKPSVLTGLSLLLVVGMIWSVPAAEPTKDDVSLTFIGNPPGCQVPDGRLVMSNASGDYYYRVEVVARVENDSPGEEICGAQSPTCDTTDPCECSLSGTYVVNPNDDRAHKSACNLPNCVDIPPVCDKHCDNFFWVPDPPPGHWESECTPAHHCVCTYGGWWVTDYSTDGSNWYPMGGSELGLTPIEEADLELHAQCPTSSCSY